MIPAMTHEQMQAQRHAIDCRIMARRYAAERRALVDQCVREIFAQRIDRLPPIP